MRPRRSRKSPRRWLYVATVALFAVLTFGIVALLMNINERKQEATQHYLKLVDLTEETIDPAEWGKNFPRQYDGYRRTAENTSRRHGGAKRSPSSRKTPSAADLRRVRIQRGLPRAAAGTPTCWRTRTRPSG